jgi:hypothetical protein
MYGSALLARHLFRVCVQIYLCVRAREYVCVGVRVLYCVCFLHPFAHFNIFGAKTPADMACCHCVKGILKQRDEMRDVQNVDTGRTPRFRFGILRVDDRAQDAESFAKMRAREGERETKRELGANSERAGNFSIFEPPLSTRLNARKCEFFIFENWCGCRGWI